MQTNPIIHPDPTDCFLGRGRIHGTQTHPVRDVGCVPFFAFKEGVEKYNATVRRGVTCRRLDDGDTIIFAKGENVTNPIIHPRKQDPSFRMGLVFMH